MAAASDRCNLLITCSGRKGYVYRPLAASPRAGHIVAADADPDAAVQAWTKHFAVVPAVRDRERYLAALEDLCAEHAIHAILPVNDLDVGLLTAERARFARVGTAVLGAPADTTATLCDKMRASDWLRERGFRTPQTWLGGAFKRERPHRTLPLVTKARSGQGSEGFRLLRVEADLDGVPDDAVVQEYLDGRHFDLDILRAADGTVVAVVAKEKIAMAEGTAAAARSVVDERLSELGTRLAGAVGHVGAIDVDVIVSGGEAHVLEINPRLGGCFPFTCIYCPEFPSALLEIAQGRAPESLLGKYRENVLAVREWSFVEVPADPTAERS